MRERCPCCDEYRDFKRMGSFQVPTDRGPDSAVVDVPLCDFCFDAGCAEEWTWEKQFRCQIPQDEAGEPLPATDLQQVFS